MQLMSYQRSAVERIVNWCRSKHGILLLHRMGSGKTASAMVALENFPHFKTRWIVAPRAIQQNWSTSHRDFGKMYDMKPEDVVYGDCAEAQPKDQNPTGRGCASLYKRMSYEQLVLDINRVAALNPHNPADLIAIDKIKNTFAGSIVAFDEAHNLSMMFQQWQNKGGDDVAAQHAQQILLDMLDGATKIILLTGTPIDRDFSNLSLLVRLAAGNDWSTTQRKVLPLEMSALTSIYGRASAQNNWKGFRIPALLTMASIVWPIAQSLISSGIFVMPGKTLSASLLLSPPDLGAYALEKLGAMTGVLPSSWMLISLIASLYLAVKGAETTLTAAKHNPKALDMDRLVDVMAPYISFLDYEFNSTPIYDDKTPIEADNLVAPPVPFSLVGSAAALLGWGQGQSSTGRPLVTKNNRRVFYLQDWFPIAERAKKSETMVSYTDFQGVICIQANSGGGLNPADMVALGLASAENEATSSQTSQLEWERFKRSIGNLSPECRYYTTHEHNASSGSRTHRQNPLRNVFQFVPRMGLLKEEQEQLRANNERGFTEHKRMFSCPKFERALDEILAYAAVDGARRKLAGIEDSNGLAYLPVVYSSLIQDGFQRFSAFLTSCGFNHIIVHGDDTDAERQERLRLGAEKKYAGVLVRTEVVSEEREICEFLLDAKSVGAVVCNTARDTAKQLQTNLSEFARNAAESVRTIAGIRRNQNLQNIKDINVVAASQPRDDDVVPTLPSIGSIEDTQSKLADAVANGFVDTPALAAGSTRRHRPLTGGIYIDRNKKVSRRFGAGDMFASPPICVLLHPAVMEGASFTHNPAMIVLEPVNGVGKQDQVYARVLRAYEKPFRAVGPAVSFVPAPASNEDAFYNGPRPIKRIVQLWSNFDYQRYYDAIAQVWYQSFSHTWPLAMLQVGNFGVSAAVGPDAQVLAANEASSTSYDDMAKILRKLTDYDVSQRHCDGAVSKCDIWMSPKTPGNCRITTMTPPFGRLPPRPPKIGASVDEDPMDPRRVKNTAITLVYRGQQVAATMKTLAEDDPTVALAGGKVKRTTRQASPSKSRTRSKSKSRSKRHASSRSRSRSPCRKKAASPKRKK